jgi:hypothetical protein
MIAITTFGASFSGFSAFVALFLFLFVPVALVSLIVSKTARFGYRRKQLFGAVIVTEYDPPAGLSPAEVGYLFDSNFGKRELIATLVSLEQRGLTEISNSKITGLRTSTGQNPDTSLKKHEAYVLNNLPDSTNITAYYLQHGLGFKQSVKESLLKQGYVDNFNATINYPVRRTLIAYLMIVLLTAVFFLWGGDDVGAWIVGLFVLNIVLFPVFLALGFVAGAIYGKTVGTPNLWTKKLKEIWPEIEGYREFVRQVELDNLQFESEKLKERSKNKALPYAIALNLNTEWQRRFQ